MIVVSRSDTWHHIAPNQCIQLTITTASYSFVEHGNKVCENMVHFVETGEYGDDIRARIGVSFD